ncbi:MAG TPA: protein-export chaperone SecB [Kiloniellales bacterium]|nr:protein-export chaperone SecB [Kiloniellales bacterium]
MSEKSAGAAGEPAGQPTGQSGGESAEPRLSILTQYIKDLSFENPSAPVIYAQLKGQPTITVNIDVRVGRLQERLAEVALRLKLEAKAESTVAFICELEYAGLCALGGNPSTAEAERLYLVDAATLLFPFARAILANQIRDGGFAPLMLAPIDFVKLYQQRRAASDAAVSTNMQFPAQGNA